MSTYTSQCLKLHNESHVLTVNFVFYMTSQALFHICTHQYWEFWGNLFWALLYTCNVVCSMCCVIIVAMLFLPNEWYQANKYPTSYLMHCFISALTNTWNFVVNSFEPYYIHVMWCVQCVAWWYWPCFACQMSDIRLLNVPYGISSTVLYLRPPILGISW